MSAGKSAKAAGPLDEPVNFFQPLLHPGKRTGVSVIEVRQERRTNRFGRLVDHHVGQQLVLCESRFDVAAAIAPRAEFLHATSSLR
jgi:hypothetical protein